MIIEQKDDVVRLSGSLTRNQWMTIKAAANLLLTNHPEGIIVDCSHLESISEDGEWLREDVNRQDFEVPPSWRAISTQGIYGEYACGGSDIQPVTWRILVSRDI